MMRTHHNQNWGEHPAVPTGSELTFGERAADALRTGMGSWPFVLGFLGFMLTWALYNRNDGFDPYPYILLNLCLSMLAGLQGAILLISAKRQDAINAALAQHDRETVALLVAINQRQTELLEELHERLGATEKEAQP